ncbi:MAG: class I SAM-dependent methyltransferase [Verrucomicrobiae bacterium]|nr:class I SAM-dependent methyltransferase [Verrucomicrobiae bacterium]
MTSSTPPCPSCSTPCHGPFNPIHSGYSLALCAHCGLAFALPRPDFQELSDYYNGFGDRPKKLPEGMVAQIGASLDGLIRSHLPAAVSVLEIGCSTGYILSALKARGYRVTGTDLSATAVQFARETYGVTEMFCAEFPPDEKQGAFDVLILSHVIEHVLHPAEFLVQSLRFLRPGGIALILTPNFDSFGIRWFGTKYPVFCPPGHLSYLTVRSLRFMADHAGAEVLDCRTESSSRDTRTVVFNCVVAALGCLQIKGFLRNMMSRRSSPPNDTPRQNPSAPAHAPLNSDQPLLRFSMWAGRWLQRCLSPVFSGLDRKQKGENIIAVLRKKQPLPPQQDVYEK